MYVSNFHKSPFCYYSILWWFTSLQQNVCSCVMISDHHYSYICCHSSLKTCFVIFSFPCTWKQFILHEYASPGLLCSLSVVFLICVLNQYQCWLCCRLNHNKKKIFELCWQHVSWTVFLSSGIQINGFDFQRQMVPTTSAITNAHAQALLQQVTHDAHTLL